MSSMTPIIRPIWSELLPSSSIFLAVAPTDSAMVRILPNVSSTTTPPWRAVSAACRDDSAALLEFSETCRTVEDISCMAVATCEV